MRARTLRHDVIEPLFNFRLQQMFNVCCMPLTAHNSDKLINAETSLIVISVILLFGYSVKVIH